MISIDPNSAEVVFAQKLASCEPTIRTKAVNRLRKWINLRQHSNAPMNTDDCMKLWKGLYYCMWMQDKPLLQEQLADNLASLLNSFTSDEQKLLYLETFLMTMAREWNLVDRWRMDKFMMLMRKMLRASLAWLKKTKFEAELLDDLLSMWSKTVVSRDQLVCPDGLKYHFASMMLDELDQCADITSALSTTILTPYVTILGMDIHDQLFDTVVHEIFDTVLLDFSHSLIPNEEEGEKMDNAGVQFDYAALANKLFDVGKQKSVKSNRRLKIYELVRRFRLAGEGLDPDDDAIDSADMPTKNMPINVVKKATKTLLDISKPLPSKKKRRTTVIEDVPATKSELILKPKKVKKKVSKDRMKQSKKKVKKFTKKKK